MCGRAAIAFRTRASGYIPIDYAFTHNINLFCNLVFPMCTAAMDLVVTLRHQN